MTTYLDRHSLEEIVSALQGYFDSLPPEHPEKRLLEKTTPEIYAQKYSEKVSFWKPQIPNLIEQFNDWVEGRSIKVNHKITSRLPVVFYDGIISSALGLFKQESPLNNLETLIIGNYSTTGGLLSQLAQIASYDSELKQVGYINSHWFNGGINLIIEESFSKPEDFESFLKVQTSSAHMHWFTRRIIKEIEIPEETVIKGYFHQGPERDEVLQSLHKRFNTNLEGLRDFYPLPITADIRQITEDILNNKPVTLTYPANNAELKLIYHTIAQLFSNVTVVEKPIL